MKCDTTLTTAAIWCARSSEKNEIVNKIDQPLRRSVELVIDELSQLKKVFQQTHKEWRKIRARPMKHGRYLVIGLIVSFLGNIPLMGLPGGVLVSIIVQIMEGIGVAKLHSDSAWPAAIATTFLWGFLLWPCYWLNHWLGWHELMVWLIWFIAGLAVAAIICGLNAKA